MPAFVPDWDPSKTKTKPRTAAPFVCDSIDSFVSTYQTHFAQLSTQAPRVPIKPAMAYPWKEASESLGGRMPNSTSQDGYQHPPAFKQAPNFKPPNSWESVPYNESITTTSRTAFVPHGYAARKPIVPVAQPLNDAKFVTRSTSFDAYKGYTQGRVMPVYPKSSGTVFNADVPSSYETTSRNGYVAHSVKPYIAATKPPNTLDSVS